MQVNESICKSMQVYGLRSTWAWFNSQFAGLIIELHCIGFAQAQTSMQVDTSYLSFHFSKEACRKSTQVLVSPLMGPTTSSHRAL